MDNLNNTFTITNDNYLNLIVYEEETFIKLFPDRTNDDYIKTQFVVDYPYEAIVHFEENHNNLIEGSRFVVIDNEYIDWCKNNNETPSTAINKYARALSDLDADRLWCKNNKNYDLVLSSIPIIIKYCYDESKYSRYYNFSYETLLKARNLLSKTFDVDTDDIFIFKNALTKEDALVNTPIIEEYFKSLIEDVPVKSHLVKSIFRGYEENSFSIKYILCGIKINRSFKMSKDLALKDSKINLGKFLVNDEMATLSKILSEENPNFIIYPSFDRLVGIKEIESSDKTLREFLPQLIS